MHSAAIFFALAAVACVSAGGHGHGVAIEADIYARPAYTSSYSVADASTGDQKSASETRDGDLTKGSYSVVQPDGLTRTVNYAVDPVSGFNAQVSYSGAGWSAAPVAVVANQGWGGPVAVAAPVAIAAGPVGWAGPGWGLPVGPIDTPDVAHAKAAHAAAHNSATANALAALSAARGRAAVGPVVVGGPAVALARPAFAVGAGPAGGWGWGLPVPPQDTPDVTVAKINHAAAHAEARARNGVWGGWGR